MAMANQNDARDTQGDALREYYAQLVTANGGTTDERVVAAFATTPREQFTGAGPWQVFAAAGRKYLETPSADLAYLYQDVLVGLAPERGINNGAPSLHARCLAALEPKPGETALHIGAGTGYYSAILAKLVGSSGSVIAYEIEEDLAESAIRNLSATPNVSVRQRSGAGESLPSADIAYVNAGATHPLDAWLDSLNPGGRLLFPLTPAVGLGGMLLITRRAAHEFAARFVSSAQFIPCVGARDEESSKRLAEAFPTRSLFSVQSLRRATPPDDTCWYAGPGWWLSTAS
jgi:protein-L-isoaspartate(D-aspartate) O-methyltransferase